MPTTKQKKIAELLIENIELDKPLTGGQMLAKVGYSKTMQTAKVNDVLESEGVKTALNDYGFNPEKAKEVVGKILTSGENDNVKIKAADMIFKVHSTYAPEKSVRLNLNRTEDSKLDALIEQIEDGLDNPEGTA